MSKYITVAVSVIVLFLSGITSSVWASNYGECSYGSSQYSTGNCGESGSNSNSDSSSSNLTTPGCSSPAPGEKTPWLYTTTTRNRTSITLYFTQADQPFDRYYVRYGIESGDYLYGSEFTANGDTRITTINDLSPKTKYYFQMRAGNDCATGEWSNELAGSTGTSNAGGGSWLRDNFTVGKSKNLKIVDIEANQLDKNGEEENADAQDMTEDQEEQIGEESQDEGITVKVKVLDTNGQSAPGVKVVLHSDPMEELTDQDGVATFTNVERGEHKIIVEHDKQTGEQAINLSGEADEYVITVQLETADSGYSLIQVVGAVIASIIAFALLLFFWKRRKHQATE